MTILLLQSTDVTEQTPRSLYLTAALLIREGFIALEDLYPHVRGCFHHCIPVFMIFAGIASG